MGLSHPSTQAAKTSVACFPPPLVAHTRVTPEDIIGINGALDSDAVRGGGDAVVSN